MNTYQKLSKLKDELFHRKTGVKRRTFERMVEILKEAEVKKKRQGGKPNKLFMRGKTSHVAGIHERISNIFSYRGKLGSVGQALGF